MCVPFRVSYDWPRDEDGDDEGDATRTQCLHVSTGFNIAACRRSPRLYLDACRKWSWMTAFLLSLRIKVSCER